LQHPDHRALRARRAAKGRHGRASQGDDRVRLRARPFPEGRL
ncbi:MAG: hypothetical protein AVDCRST_MAG22-1125, partial [uncultured Rubrobacteraceae bacterium]